MRKSNREITDLSEIADIVRNTDTIRLGINDEKFPYVVPVSFGFDFINGKFTFFFHGAKDGKKISLLRKNSFVCLEGDICYRFRRTKLSVTCLYESFIAFGKCCELSGEQAVYGLKSILSHCNYADVNFDEKILPAVSVYKVEIESITAKMRDKIN